MKPTTGAGGAPAPVRYAVRQVLDQEHRRDMQRIRAENRFARATGPNRPDAADGDKENAPHTATAEPKKRASAIAGKRDFFGRIINEARPGPGGRETESATAAPGKAVKKENAEERVWVSFHEGFSNAVRKPITLREFLDSF